MGDPLRRLSLALILSAPLALGAQESVTLEQSLTLNYNRSSAAQGAFNETSTLQQATYNFSLGMPILEYRLGSLNLTSALDYLKERNGEEQASRMGLPAIGIAGTLFPYQPYHINFDYSRVTTPGLFGAEREKSQTFGLGLSYRGFTLQQIELNFRHGELAGPLGHQDWSSLQLKGVQNYARTNLQYRADHIVFGSADGQAIASSTASMDSRTQLAADWILQDSLGAQVLQGSKSLQANVNLTGTSGGWTSMSSVSATYLAVSSQAAEGLALGQSLAHTWGRLSAYAQAGVLGQHGNGATGALSENISLGLSCRLGQSWYLSGDGGFARNATSAPAGTTASTSSTSSSLHTGLSFGGGIPELLKRALFYWSDLRLQHRIAQDYPPGYVPPELAALLFERRMSREGNTQFSLDVTHLQNGLSGQEDWGRIAGSLSFRNGLMFRILGDWRKDDGFTTPGASLVDKDASLAASFSIYRTRVNLGWGFSRAISSTPTAPSRLDPDSPLPLPSGAQIFSSVGIDTSFWGVPWGALYLQHRDAFGENTTIFSTHLSTSFRSLSCSFAFSEGRQSNGLRTSQVNVSIRRWFDTIPLWELGN